MKLVIIIAIAFVFLIPISVYAEEYEGKKPLRFYQIFASNDIWYNQGCEDQKNSFLRSKTIQVLKMYDYLPITSKMECVKVTGEIELEGDKWNEESPYGLTMKQVMDRAEDWNPDLLIIVLDETFSSSYLKESFNIWPHGAMGHISYRDHTIFTRTHFEGIEQIDPQAVEQKTATRTMAHEIAHFAVQQKVGYELASGTQDVIATKAVHDVDDLFDKCLYSNSLNTCTHLWVPLKTHSGIPIEVMSPDYVLQVAESMKPKTSTSANPSYSSKTTNNPDSINELIGDYGDKKTKIKYEISNKINKYQKLSFESSLAKAKHGSVLNQLSSINFETSDYNVNIHSQNWMKGLHSVGENGVREEIKKLYGISNKLKQFDAEIVKANHLESEYKIKQSLDEKKSTTKQSQSFAGSSNDLKPSLYVINDNGKKSKEITVKPNENFTVEGYIYKNNIPQKHTSYKIYDNIGNSMDGRTNSNGFFKYIFTAEHSSYQNIGQGNNKGSTLISKVCVSSNCEEITVFVRGDGYETKTSTSKIGGKQEAIDLQILAYDKMNSIKKEIDDSKNALEKVSPNSAEQKDKINQAWSLLKDSQMDLESMERRIKGGDNHVGYENYETAKTFFDNENINEQLEGNLKEISQLIEESKPQSCFLFWCW